LEFFGDLKGKSIVELGCGTGSFLKTCIMKGASFALGIDINEAMIKTGGHAVDHQIPVSSGLHFIIGDCFEPIQANLGQFDFVTCQFVLHDCSNKENLLIFLKNVSSLLKPGGKVFIGMCPYFANTTEDQETIANLCGYLQHMKSESDGKDPFFTQVPSYRPGKNLVGELGRPFTRDELFAFSDYFWSKEKIIEALVETGFTAIATLPPTFPDNVALDEQKQIQNLEEPFILIGAEKVKN